MFTYVYVSIDNKKCHFVFVFYLHENLCIYLQFGYLFQLTILFGDLIFIVTSLKTKQDKILLLLHSPTGGHVGCFLTLGIISDDDVISFLVHVSLD